MDVIDLATNQPEHAPEVGETGFVDDSDSPRTIPLPANESIESSTPLEHPSSNQVRPAPSGYFLLSGVALVDAHKSSSYRPGRVISPEQRDAILNAAAEMGGTIVPLQSIVVRRPHDEILMELSQAEGPDSPWMAASVHLESARGRRKVLWSNRRLYDLEDGQFVDREGHRLDPAMVRPEGTWGLGSWGLGNGDQLLFRGPNYRGFRFSFHVEGSESGGTLKFSGPRFGHTTWMHGEYTSIGSFGVYLPGTVMLGQTVYYELHGGNWTQVLLTFGALDPNEWRDLLEGAARESVPQDPNPSIKSH